MKPARTGEKRQTQTRPYLLWQGQLEPRQLYSQPSPAQYPFFYNNQLYVLEQLAAEGGRCVLVRLSAEGTKETLTPAAFNIRSRVHEYGGKAFLLADGAVWFSNDSDRRIYRQSLTADARPVALSVDHGDDSDKSQEMAIDFQLTADARYLLFVQESPQIDGENRNMLAVLPLHGPLPASSSVLVSGADFYANPVLSPDGSRLAWIEWNHPQMPWDGTLLKTGCLQEDSGQLSVDPASIEIIAGGTECAVCQLQFSADGKLYFSLDGDDKERGLQAGCWDLFSWDGQGLVRITDDDVEYGEAHWIFGQQRYTLMDDGSIMAIRTESGRDQLVEISPGNGRVDVITNEASTELSNLSSAGKGAVVYSAASFSRQGAIHVFSQKTGEISKHFSNKPLLHDNEISIPQHLSFPTTDGEFSHAWYYPPKNPLYSAPADDLPPLLVMVHGGPTSRCDSELNYQRQYWTGRGFGVLDVNHRGSTGYCRSYRQSLLGQWGLLDSQDVADAVDYVIQQKLAHPQQICVRGGSAGGYVVLRALTLFPDMFCAGACYYGIGNLVTLMEFTHKFEAHYLDGLLAAPYLGKESDRPGSPYYDRSPVHDLNKLKSPMIVFQGNEDKVVPPELSHELIKSLKSRGIHHQYVEYPGEGHGFRKMETRIDALEKESAFFYDVIKNTRD